MDQPSSTAETLLLPDWSDLPPPVRGTWQSLAADLPLPPDTQFSGSRRRKLFELEPAEWEARIGRDPVLAGKVLAVANSAALGQASPVASVARAVVLLGYNLLEAILIAYHLEGVIGRWPDFPRAHFEFVRDCSAAAAVCGFHLARAAGLEDPELVGTSALLARLGALVLGLAWPAPGEDYLRKPDEVARVHYEMARWRVGTCHLSALVARQWGLPEVLQQLLENHTRPLLQTGTPASGHRETVAVCCSTVLGTGQVRGVALADCLDNPAYTTLHLNLSACGLTEAVAAVLSDNRLARELQALAS